MQGIGYFVSYKLRVASFELLGCILDNDLVKTEGLLAQNERPRSVLLSKTITPERPVMKCSSLSHILNFSSDTFFRPASSLCLLRYNTAWI